MHIHVYKYILKDIKYFIKKVAIYCRKYLQKQSEESCCNCDGTTNLVICRKFSHNQAVYTK